MASKKKEEKRRERNANDFPKINVIYKKNMEALKQRYPQIAQKIEKLAGDKNFQIVKSENNIPNLYFPAQNFYYYQPDNPIKDIENQIKALKLKNTRIALFLGIGLGYEVRYYIEKMVAAQNTSFILIVEKDLQIFNAALHTMDLTPIIENDQAGLFVGIDEQKLFHEFRNYFAQSTNAFLLIKAVKPVYHLSSLCLYKDYYLKALQEFRKAGVFHINYYGNNPQDSLIGVENMLENIDEIIHNPGINLLYNSFKGHPAVVVSSGPSLNKNKQFLKGLEDKAVIIAADSALRILTNMGVKPHFVTMLERDEGMYKLMEGYQAEEVKDTYFTACPVIRKESYEVYPGPRIIVYRNFDHFKWLGIERGILEIKHSAGNMSFKIAAAMGCDPIILIGQDLAFGEEGVTHAQGMVMGEKSEFHYKLKPLEVMGNNGKMVYTNEGWHTFLKAYEIDVAQYSGRCINSTEGGAYIQGTTVMPFQEAIDKYIQESFLPLEIIKEKVGGFTTEQANDEIVKIRKLIDDTIEDLIYVRDNCREGLSVWEQHKAELEGYLRESDKVGRDITSRILEIEADIVPRKQMIDKCRKSFGLFFMHIIQSFHLNFEIDNAAVPDQYEHEIMAKADIALRYGKWFLAIGEIAEICLNLLYSTKERINEVDYN